MRPLRIAAHNGAPEFGGAEIATARLLAGLQERGHEVVLFYNREVVAEGVRPYGIELRHAHLGGDVAVHHAVRFALRLRRWRPDVLIVGTFRKLWLAALAARLGGVGTVVARIGLSSDIPRSAKYRIVFRRMVDLVIANDTELADAYRSALPGAPPPGILTIHKGIRVRATRPAAATRRELGIPAGARLIGGVGRLVPQKRFDRLLDAVARLPEDVHCLIVGGGPLREALESQARALGIAERVRFTGHSDRVPDLLAALEVMVVSSDRESLANVMLEALAVGTPVVSTEVSGAREALAPLDRDGIAPGVIVEASAEAIAGAVAELVTRAPDAPDPPDAPRRARMAEAARAISAARFGRKRMLDEWEAALRDAAGEGDDR